MLPELPQTLLKTAVPSNPSATRARIIARSLRRVAPGLAAMASLACAPTGSSADVVISTAATQNMSCSSGVCTPTASDAVLNVNDLENLLASGNLEVTTTGSGVQADNIDIGDAFAWSNSSTLSLDAYDSIAFASAVSVTGLGGLSLTTSDGGSGMLSFGQTGSASFANLGSALAINGVSYTLENSIATLAGAIAANPAGNFALANSYDASQDGTYKNSPIATELTGTVEGLGNTISNLSINHPQEKGAVDIGLFSDVGSFSSTALIASVRLTGLNIATLYYKDSGYDVGGLVGRIEGSLFDDHVAGTLRATRRMAVGGLAGFEYSGTVANCSADVTILMGGYVGGLLGGLDTATMEQSYATGIVAGDNSAGGLIGQQGEYGTVMNSYSTATVSTKALQSAAGGLVGRDSENHDVENSYSTGPVSGGYRSLVGGLVGEFSGTAEYNYWDTKTSGTSEGTGEGNVSGITGLTTRQLRSGLPQGFDPAIWAEQKGINGGFPYLIANPPPVQ